MRCTHALIHDDNSLSFVYVLETRSHKCNEKPEELDRSGSVTDSSCNFSSDEKLNNLTPNSRTPHQSANSSPHPPPRHRQQKMLAQSQSSHCVSTSKTRTSNLNNPSQHGNANYNSHYTYNNQRNKISFKDMHTAFGRPVLRDRNLWRHQRKSNLILEKNSQKEVKQLHAEQNLLISL